MNRVFVYVVLLSSLLATSACRDRESGSAAYFEQLFQDRIARLVGRIEADCQEEILEAARAQADSLLLDRARRIRRIAGRPPRPNRPGAPPRKELSAPLPLRPLFPFEIRFDTLLRDSLYQDSLRLDSIDQGLLAPLPPAISPY